MTATICDRCGKLTEPLRRAEVEPTFPYYLCEIKMLPYAYGIDEKPIDLCEDCKREFKKWLKGEKDGLE